MPQSLLIRLPAPGQDETEWLTLDEAGAPAPTRQRGPLSLAAAVSRTGRLIVLAPATQILLAEPELPPGSGVETRACGALRIGRAADRGCRSVELCRRAPA